MRAIDEKTFKETAPVSNKTTRILISFTLLMAFLISATALVRVRPARAIDRANASSSVGRAPTAPKPSARAARSMSPPLSVWSGTAQDVIYPAFALDIGTDEELVKIPDTTTPGTWDTIATTPDTDYFAGDFVGRDYDKLYVLDFTSNELHSLDTATGADTNIGSSIPDSDHVWAGATGTADGILYASSTNLTTSSLYMVNTATGVATVLGEITNAPCLVDIAINADGEMYGLDICTDELVQIDPTTGAGTVIGSVGFDADFAQGMDFEETSGVLYLAAYNATDSRGELRIANTASGNSVLVGAFPDGDETDALAFVNPAVQTLRNPGFESNWNYWETDGYPTLSKTSHSGNWSAMLFGKEVWVWQWVLIPFDATDVSISYWLTGISSDSDWDNDIIYVGLWDLTRQNQLAVATFGLTYFYSYPMVWKTRTYTLDADELASVAGKILPMGIRLKQDWNPGYHRTSTAYVDDVALYVARPIYDYGVFLPLATR